MTNIRAALDAAIGSRGDITAIARLAGVSAMAVRSIYNGDTKNPGVGTVEKIMEGIRQFRYEKHCKKVGYNKKP